MGLTCNSIHGLCGGGVDQWTVNHRRRCCWRWYWGDVFSPFRSVKILKVFRNPKNLNNICILRQNTNSNLNFDGLRILVPWPPNGGKLHCSSNYIPFASLRSLEVVGERENGRTRGRHARGDWAPSPLACLVLSRAFFLVPTTSKRLLRRLSICQHLSHLKNPPLSKPASPRKRKQDITHKANLLNSLWNIEPLYNEVLGITKISSS